MDSLNSISICKLFAATTTTTQKSPFQGMNAMQDAPAFLWLSVLYLNTPLVKKFWWEEPSPYCRSVQFYSQWSVVIKDSVTWEHKGAVDINWNLQSWLYSAFKIRFLLMRKSHCFSFSWHTHPQEPPLMVKESHRHRSLSSSQLEWFNASAKHFHTISFLCAWSCIGLGKSIRNMCPYFILLFNIQLLLSIFW